MEAEYYRIPVETAGIGQTRQKENGKNVFAMGTTTMRTLESSITASKMLKASEGWTNLFVYPPYDFSIANRMITNSLAKIDFTYYGFSALCRANY